MSQQLRRGNWSVQELERLRLLLPLRGVEHTARLLRRSADSVQRKALDILRVPPRRGGWTTSDDWQLRQSWGAVEPRLLGPMLGRAVSDVRRRAAELRGRMASGPWTRDELRMLKKLYGTRGDADLEVCLLRDRAEIAVAARRLCLAKDKRFRAAAARLLAGGDGAQPRPRSRMPRWTSAEISRLKQLYPDNDNLTVARELGRSVTSVANKAFQLGVHKSAGLLADIGRSNIALRYLSGSTVRIDVEPAEHSMTSDDAAARLDVLAAPPPRRTPTTQSTPTTRSTPASRSITGDGV